MSFMDSNIWKKLLEKIGIIERKFGITKSNLLETEKKISDLKSIFNEYQSLESKILETNELLKNKQIEVKFNKHDEINKEYSLLDHKHFGKVNLDFKMCVSLTIVPSIILVSSNKPLTKFYVLLTPSIAIPVDNTHDSEITNHSVQCFNGRKKIKETKLIHRETFDYGEILPEDVHIDKRDKTYENNYSKI
ncbi:hypothetical protein ACTFIU_008829 [Dictyostelium citrinum]